MNWLKIISFFFLAAFFSCVRAGNGFVYLKDTTSKLFYVSDKEVYSPDKNQLLYFQKGNIFFSAGSDEKRNMFLLTSSMDAGSKDLEMIYEKDEHEPVYSFQDNKFFQGKATSEELREKNELIHIESSKKWLGFYASATDSLLAYYRIDSFPPCVAILVAYTVIKKYELDKKLVAKAPKSNSFLSFLKATVDPQTPVITSAYSIIKPASGNVTANEWIWDGKVLRPQWNLDQDLMWTFDGQIVKQLYVDNINEQYTWDGHIFKPVAKDDRAMQWSWDGKAMKPVWDKGWKNEYVIEDGIVKRTSDPNVQNEWYLDGNIPVPLVILIISGIAHSN